MTGPNPHDFAAIAPRGFGGGPMPGSDRRHSAGQACQRLDTEKGRHTLAAPSIIRSLPLPVAVLGNLHILAPKRIPYGFGSLGRFAAYYNFFDNMSCFRDDGLL